MNESWNNLTRQNKINLIIGLYPSLGLFNWEGYKGSGIMKSNLIMCNYFSDLKDELLIEIKHEGKIFRGTISEVIE